MKKLFIVLLVSSTFISLQSCKKANLTRDQWKIEKATDLEDGSDITADYEGDTWEFQKDEKFFENGELKGNWAWIDGKERFMIAEQDGSVDEYDVLKLKRNEMWLKIPNEEEIHFSRIK